MTMGVYTMEMPTFNTLATSYCSEESTKTYVVMRESGAFWPIRVQLGGESLKKQKWEYTITNGITGVIISFIMLTIFGSLALWFRISRNGAIIIGIILVIFASLAFFLALYRTLFFRVLIDKDGFFYQTAPGNGRYYHYYTILQIWVSSGNDANAQQMQYCNFETQDGRIMRFFFRNPDWDAVDYLIARVENTAGQVQKDDDDLVISGRVQGGVRLVAAVCILAAVLLVNIYLRTQGLSPIICVPPIVLAVAAFFVLVSHNLFYKILIANCKCKLDTCTVELSESERRSGWKPLASVLGDAAAAFGCVNRVEELVKQFLRGAVAKLLARPSVQFISCSQDILSRESLNGHALRNEGSKQPVVAFVLGTFPRGVGMRKVDCTAPVLDLTERRELRAVVHGNGLEDL